MEYGFDELGGFSNSSLPRKLSVSGCVEEMKKNPGNYHKQFSCAQIIGTLAGDESMKFVLVKPDAISCLMTALKNYPNETDLQLNIFTSLLNIASFSEANCTHIVTHNGVSIIQNTLRNHLESPTIVKLVLNTTKYISSSVNLAKTLAANELNSEILLAMSKHSSDTEILSDGCFILGNLLVSEKIAHHLMSLGVVQTIVSLFEKFPDDNTVMENVCRTLGCFAVFDKLCLDISKSGVTLAVVKLLKSKTANVFLFESCLWALACLTTTESTVKHVSTSAVASHLMKVFKQFPINMELAEVIMVTSSQITSGNDDIRNLVEDDGASKSIIAAMLMFDRSSDIQEVGCLSLMNLTAESRENKIRATNSGAVPTLLHTISEFAQNSNTVLLALKALSNLISVEEACHQILDSKGLDILASTIDTFHQDTDVLAETAQVLSGIAHLSDLKQADMEDVYQRLMSIWSLAQNDVHAVLNICLAWEYFAKTDQGRQLIKRNRTLENVLQAMERFTQDELLQYTGCRIIALESLYGCNQEFIMAEKSLRSVLVCMEKFQLEAEMQIVGCGTLSCIVNKLDGLKETCVSLGGVSCIARSLDSNVNDFRVAYVTVLALGHLMPIDAKKHPAESALAVSTVLGCMKTFLTNKDIVTVGCQILSKSVLTESLSTELNKIIETAARHHRCNFQFEESSVAVRTLDPHPHSSLTGVTTVPLASLTGVTTVPLASLTGVTTVPLASLTGVTTVPLARLTGVTTVPLVRLTGVTTVPLASLTIVITVPLARPTGVTTVPLVSMTGVMTVPLVSMTGVTTVPLDWLESQLYH
ncbi:hypothetical protein Btru_009745 [Bulinus truncatus]|nr:hypothetical protein Btru_009745 [Bulinus truncatus]